MTSLIKVLFVIINLTVNLFVYGSDQLPPGYYAFEKATRVHGVPPRVLKPPYLPADVPCPGAVKSDYRLSPKDTLCGDLNKGYVPLNPMMQTIAGQPYPFELIKNKTLHFLARSLPFLKQDINNIPKVAKLPANSDPGILGSSSYLGNPVNNKYDFQSAPNPNHLIKKRSLANFTSLRWDLLKEAKFAGHGLNFTEARQKVCEQNEGMLCQVMQALGGGHPAGGLLNTLSSAAQVMTAASNAANTAQSLSSLASLIGQLSGATSSSGSATNSGSSSGSSGSSSTSTSSSPSSSSSGSTSGSSSSSSSGPDTKSMFTQVLNLLASLNANSASTASLSSLGSSSSSSSNNFSPLSAIVDYLMNVNPTAISSLLPARRKKPLDFEDIAATETMTVSQVPPTPCPSIEEYVAPVYARNYQGVWKYVVQIPHEGYFTQTVQKTSCVKGRCDFMEGVCHESPRWVSLLVAEIFYPSPKFPNLMASASEVKPYTIQPTIKPKQPYNMAMNQHMNPMNHLGGLHGHLNNPLNVHLLGAGQPMVYPEIDQYLNRKIGYREEPFMSATDSHGQHYPQQHGGRLAKPRMMMFNDDETNNKPPHQVHHPKPPTPSGSASSSSSSSSSSSGSPNSQNNRNKEPTKEEECDGHDSVGCYQMRVYYDWFLIPGSCKCWKKTASQGSSLDTLKKLFIGK